MLSSRVLLASAAAAALALAVRRAALAFDRWRQAQLDAEAAMQARIRELEAQLSALVVERRKCEPRRMSIELEAPIGHSCLEESRAPLQDGAAAGASDAPVRVFTKISV